MNGQTKRQTELDILRLLATLAVIMNHAAGNSYLSPALSVAYYGSFNVVVLASVPLFVMISGRFFLDNSKNISLEKILKKYMPHVILPFITWSVVYTCYYYASGAYDGLNIFGMLSQFLQGPYHFWYLYTLLGLYALTPFLRKIVDDKRLLLYFLALFVVFNVTYEYIIYIPKLGNIVKAELDGLNLQWVSRFVGYYVLGYFIYLKQTRIEKKGEILIYILGVVSLIGTAIAAATVSDALKESEFVKQFMKPNMVIIVVAIYVLFLKRVSRIAFPERMQVVFSKLTELSFGVYILHALVNEVVSYIPLPQPIQHPYIWLFMLTIVIYLASLGLTILIRRIPVIGKKIT